MSTDEHQKQPEQSEQDIPELTQQIPELSQVIPELTERLEETVVSADEIPELTERLEQDDSDHQSPQDEDLILEISYPVTTIQVSDHELEKQQWQIEQQATLQMGEWHSLARVEPADTVPENESDSIQQDSGKLADESDELDKLTDEQFRLLDATWERLENVLMDHMPPEMAGILMTMLDEQYRANKNQIARSLRLLETETLDELLKYFDIDKGF